MSANVGEFEFRRKKIDSENSLSKIVFPNFDSEFSLSIFVLIFWESQYVSPNVPHIMHEPA